MKNQTSKVLILVIVGLISIAVGCLADVSQNDQNASNSNLSNQNSSNKDRNEDKTLSLCEEVEGKIIDALPRNIIKQLNNKTLVMDYSANAQLLTLKGRIYTNFDEWQEFINILDNFRSEDCIRVISFQGKTEKNFKWCPTKDCTTKVPDAHTCNKITVIDQIFNNSSVSEQINKHNNLSQKYNRGNDGGLPIIGLVGDLPNSKTFSLLFAKLSPKINSCITNITLEPNSGNMNNLLRQGFEWQICDGGRCECNGQCISCNDNCLRKIDDTNTNGNTINSNVP